METWVDGNNKRDRRRYRIYGWFQIWRLRLVWRCNGWSGECGSKAFEEKKGFGAGTGFVLKTNCEIKNFTGIEKTGKDI